VPGTMVAAALQRFAPPVREAAVAAPHHAAASAGGFPLDDVLARCKVLLDQQPPMEGSMKYRRTWTVEESLEQHQCLLRQHELQSQIGHNRTQVTRVQVEVARVEAERAAVACRAMVDSAGSAAAAMANDPKAFQAALHGAHAAARLLRQTLELFEHEERERVAKTKWMEKEIAQSNHEMTTFRQAIDGITNGDGPDVPGMQEERVVPVVDSSERQYFYCSDCKLGGHCQRFCLYLLKRPNWRIYPAEKWFEDRNGQTSYCPLGKRGVDFTDETYFSRIAMHIKGRIWLEDKRKLYEFVPDLMPLTYIIQDRRWVGAPPQAEPPDAPPMPWFVKGTDRNFGTSVMCCARPEDCMGLVDSNTTYVVQKHIPDPLLYKNGEKCHIKFYNLLVGFADGVTWKLYTYKDGYLSISPKPWSPTDLSKETQVTIIRTKRINDWEPWPRVYPKCQEGVAEVMRRAAEQGKLEGRNKIQFEIFSADYIVTANEDVYLLEFNMGPVLRDPDDSPDVHDAGMILGALHIVEPWEGGDEDQWDLALECKGVPPRPS